MDNYSWSQWKITCVLCVGKIIATALPPVSTEGLGPDDVNDLSDKVREMMLSTYEKTTTEVMALCNSSDKEKSH